MPPPPLPDSDDHLRCMTVVPYLEDLHHGGTSSDEYGEEEEELEEEPEEEEDVVTPTSEVISAQGL